ncbi:longitudinals lacking protein, isoforms A/B/D/L-like [Rhynchophorus ferrugineus]|uniref:longitudinals lacking protein, isoforms A/B/D/L-like n=1 Tax=Rhynchophorus ferrugineus TaxID=354439 RepID=UPI003FCC2FD9
MRQLPQALQESSPSSQPHEARMWQRAPDRQGYFICTRCHKAYKLKSSLRNHQYFECGKEPNLFCPNCPYRTKIKFNFRRHLRRHQI